MKFWIHFIGLKVNTLLSTCGPKVQLVDLFWKAQILRGKIVILTIGEFEIF